MSSSVPEFGFGWTELLSLGKKRKSIEEELELNLLCCIQRRRISPCVDGPDLSHNPLNCCGDRLLPVHLLQLDSAASLEYEKCLDLKTGRFYMVKSSVNTTRRRQCMATLSSTPIPSFGEKQVEEEVSLDLGLHLSNNTSLDLIHNNNDNNSNNRQKRCNASPTRSSISFQEVKGNEEFGPLYENKGNSNSSSSSSSGLVTMGCQKCLIFLMVSEEDPFCPRCGTSSPSFMISHSTRHLSLHPHPSLRVPL